MDSVYNHQRENEIYSLWEQSGAFNPDTQENVDTSKPTYTILLPPPNANASLHAGHAMYVIEDILIRYHRMLGQPTLWIPGTDHAGFETQYVYEKQLSKQGKSRFQFDRETLYKDIHEFVKNNSGLIFDQLKSLGFSCDWSRSTFMLDEKVIKVVYQTFQKMVDDGLIYRDDYIVNFSPKSGTTFSELEIKYVERIDPLYFIKYGPFTVATVRPETKFRDTALAVNPNDPRYKEWIGKTITFDGVLGPVEMIVIPDEEVDMEFGTGIMKVTPAHDAHDFLLGKKHNLPVLPLIDTFGKLNLTWFLNQSDLDSVDPKYVERAKKYHGKKVAEARKLIVADMMEDGLIEKVDEKYTHNVAVDYKTGGDIEPMVLPNWFVKMKPLAERAIKAAREKEVVFVPNRFEAQFYQWLENIRDWPISRQIVWGIRMPVWYKVSDNPGLEVVFLDKNGTRIVGRVANLLDQGHSLSEIREGLQQLRAPKEATYTVTSDDPGTEYLPETDTFDTWFSSGQWPLTTLGFPEGEDFKRYFPTQVLDTMWDILFFWVSRMIMFSLYLTDQVPFKTVYLHSMVTDEKGAKMSKSKGNVVNPLDLTKKYGSDALRIALIAGSAPGNPIALSENKVKGYRNFANKLWNVGRFILKLVEDTKYTPLVSQDLPYTPQDEKLLEQLNQLSVSVTDNLDKYRFSDAALSLYDFIWNTLASEYLEQSKTREDRAVVAAVLLETLATCLKLLHPFMPFVTESIWQILAEKGLVKESQLITALWPSQRISITNAQ